MIKYLRLYIIYTFITLIILISLIRETNLFLIRLKVIAAISGVYLSLYYYVNIQKIEEVR